jgi:hypothetical protein
MMKTSWWRLGDVVARKERLKTSFSTYLGLVTWRINTRQLAGQTDECSGLICCWIREIRWAAQPNAWSRVLQTKNMNPNQQQDSTTMNTNSTKQLKMKIAVLRATGQRKEYNFLVFFSGAWYKGKN